MVRVIIAAVLGSALCAFAQDAPATLDFGPATTQPTTQSAPVQMVRLTISERGQCEFSFGPAELPQLPATMPTSAPTMRGAHLTAAGPRRWQAIYPLADAADSDLILIGTSERVGDTLVVHKPDPKWDGGFGPVRRMRLPIDVVVYLPAFTDEPVGFNIFNDFEQSRIGVTFNPKTLKWRAIQFNHEQSAALLMDTPSRAGGKLKAAIPAGKMRLTDPMTVRAWASESPASVLSLTGEFSPNWGMALKNDGTKVTVDRLEDGAAMAAGFLPGDVLVSINASTPRDTLDAIRLLSFVHVGDPTMFRVSRDGKVASVKVIAP